MENLLSPSQLAVVTRVAREFGVDSVKLTGGEPTLRRDLLDVISAIKSTGVEDLSMTTNGVLLAKLARKLKDAGLDRVNVSLHAISRDGFRRVTGVDAFNTVLGGVRAALEAGLRPLKLNYVVNSYNESETLDFLELAQSLGVDEVHLIELHPVGLGKQTFSAHVGLDRLEEKLSQITKRIEQRSKHMRPRYKLSSGMVVEVVRPYRNPLFCSGCNRIRLTTKGELKTCLYREDKVVDISEVLNGAYGEEEKIDFIRTAFRTALLIREPNFKYYPRDDGIKNFKVGTNYSGLRLLRPTIGFS
ncbi:GTP 3',8-cyclase MoaA [Sulfodiicoccus acidiphilus]|uniref:GTP 3',8-cyclase MoaA n=1 Tax=Sulfodiicoccus acidiphilus TaxID=1670455 RepID=A0A348B2Y6_9CREN|nr:GTP 3',8-cyclase MoaA [Sulfodiicoccus acidiphilus]GGT93831.1 GTP 3',8-cyclase MoaA [Sulfodiicoccus acidiphilus]